MRMTADKFGTGDAPAGLVYTDSVHPVAIGESPGTPTRAERRDPAGVDNFDEVLASPQLTGVPALRLMDKAIAGIQGCKWSR